MNWQDRENPSAGGAEIHLHEVFGRLVETGHAVTLLASGFPGGSPRLTLDGMDVRRTGGRHTFSLAAPAYYRRHLTGAGFDLLVEDLNKVPLFTPLWAGTRCVLLVHHLFGRTAFQEASPPFAAATWLLERPLAPVYRGVPVQAVSSSTAADLERRGFRPADIAVIPNGVDLEFYTPAPDGVRFAAPTVLYLGRLKRYKRVDLVIRAVARLHAQGLPVRLVVAGRGDAEPALRALAYRLGLGDAVRFAGFVSQEEKRTLFRRTWVHAFASPKEGWGISNMEAAACGTATVASDAPGLRDSVAHGRTGFLVPHGDVPALADQLAAVLSNPDLRERLGAGARSFALGFSWERAARDTAAHLEGVLRAASAPAA